MNVWRGWQKTAPETFAHRTTVERNRALAHVRVLTFFKPVSFSARCPFTSLRQGHPGDETSACKFRQSSDGISTGTAKPAFTRSIMTIVLKPLMSAF